MLWFLKMPSILSNIEQKIVPEKASKKSPCLEWSPGWCVACVIGSDFCLWGVAPDTWTRSEGFHPYFHVWPAVMSSGSCPKECDGRCDQLKWIFPVRCFSDLQMKKLMWLGRMSTVHVSGSPVYAYPKSTENWMILLFFILSFVSVAALIIRTISGHFTETQQQWQRPLPLTERRPEQDQAQMGDSPTNGRLGKEGEGRREEDIYTWIQ